MAPPLRVPLDRPQPDCARFIRAVTTDFEPPRPPLVEYLVNDAARKAVLARLDRQWVDPGGDRRQQAACWDNFIAFWHHMGYDFVRYEKAMDLPAADNREGGKDGRAFQETGKGPIGSWDNFQRYPWPDPDQVDFFPYEYLAEHLPEGMGLIVAHAAGMLEHLTRLFGYEPLCIALYDQPDLVAAVADRLGTLMARYYERLLDLPNLIAVWPGDDMGFKGGTMISPDDLRKYTLPWHRRFAEMTHAAGLPYFLHSCGNLARVHDDLIEDVKIDAKHSFEDAILPAERFKQAYGDRIGTLGGVDLDVLARRSPEQVRKYVRGKIEACAPGGRFAIGSGNSIPDYIPVENYLTMIDEALR
jgi:uroporphyrinogen decarboxylase